MFNYSILPYAIPPLFTGCVLFSLGIFCYLKNRYSKTNLYFFLLTLACSMWQISFAGMNMAKDHEIAFLFSRLVYTGVIFIPAFYYHFILHFLGLNYQRRLRFIYPASFIFLGFLWASRYFLDGNNHYYWGYAARANWLQVIYLIFFFSVFLISFYDLFKAYHKAKITDPPRANRVKYIFGAFLIALLASSDFLSTYGFDFYPAGFLFMVVFAVTTAYAIVKHKLLNIDLVIKKGVVYSLIVSFISVVYTVLILVGERISQIYLGYSSLSFTLIAMIVLSSSFVPLYNLLLTRLNKLIFKGSPEELSSENERMRVELQAQDKMKAVATLAAGMAHEVKNPLTTIKTFAEYLPEKYDDPDFRRKFKRLVTDEIDRMNHIVGQLLDFAKPHLTDLKAIRIDKVIDETLELLSNNFLQKKIKVQRKFKPNLVIAGDKNQLKQVFLNLFLNSINAMGEGGVLTVSIDLPGHLNGNKGSVIVNIHDNGRGIRKEDQPHIFEPFYTTNGEAGTGLGLAIVYGIIKEHGGNIKVQSEPGKGTEFEILLKA